MSIFNSVTLSWQQKTFTVPAHKIMGLIATVEDIITIIELSSGKTPPLSKLAMAYAAALRYAGCQSVTDEDVYAALFTEDASFVHGAIMTLLAMMIPPDKVTEKGAAKKKPPVKKRAS